MSDSYFPQKPTRVKRKPSAAKRSYMKRSPAGGNGAESRRRRRERRARFLPYRHDDSFQRS